MTPPTRRPPPSGRLAPEHLLFLLSGTAGLLLEVLWLRELGLLLGNGTYATALTLAVFFLGLAIGGHLWGLRAPSFRRPLAAYGTLELGIAASALVLLLLFEEPTGPVVLLREATGDGEAGRLLVPALLATGALSVPAVLMGGTFPVMGQHLIRWERRLGHEGARLYGINTLGGVLGVLLAGFVLPRALGYRAAYLTAVGLAAGVGLAALWLAARRGSEGATPPSFSLDREAGTRDEQAGKDGRGPEGEQPAGRSRWLSDPFLPLALLALVSGAATLAAQVLWTRMMARVLHNSVYSFAAILATFLVALGLGGLLASALSRRVERPWSALAWILLLGGVAASLSGVLFYHLTDGLAYFLPTGGWWSYVASLFGLTAATIAVPALLLGTVFPFLLRIAEGSEEAPGPVIGRLVLVNSLGAVVGSLAAGFVVLEWIGVWGGLALLGYGYALLAAAVSLSRTRLPAVPAGALAALALLVLVVRPSDLPAVRTEPGERLLATWEGSLGTVSVTREGTNLKMELDGHYVLGDTRSTGSERMQGHLPLLLHDRPRDVYFLGLGTGITAGAALQHPVDSMVATELVPEVVAAARRFFAPFASGLFEDPRARILVQDGRVQLRNSPRRYDVVVGDLFTPWHAGTGALYSREHFRNVRAHLRPGGLFAQWLPLYQLSREEFLVIARTMTDVFPQVTMWRGNFSPVEPVVALVGRPSRRPFPARDFAGNARRLFWGSDAAPEVEWGALARLFYAGNLGRADSLLAGIPVNTEDRPRIEFLAPVKHYRDAASGTSTRLVGRRLEALYEELLAHAPPEEDPYLSSHGAERENFARTGLAYYRYRILRAEGAAEAALRAWRTTLGQLPSGLARELGSLVEGPTGSQHLGR
jgi:spermidine synthase